jgi:hypothetical protein
MEVEFIFVTERGGSLAELPSQIHVKTSKMHLLCRFINLFVFSLN